MRKALTLGAVVTVVAFGQLGANAGTRNVPSWSPYATIETDPALPVMNASPMVEGRSAYTIDNPEGPLNDFYKGVGLSDNPDDCNKGCAVSNGG